MDKKGKDNQEKRGITRRELLKMVGPGLGAAVLVGCAPKVAETLAAPTQAPPPATVAPKAVTLRYQNHWTKETDAHYKGMEWLYKEFQAKYPNITIDNVLNPDSQESYKKITGRLRCRGLPRHHPRSRRGNVGFWLPAGFEKLRGPGCRLEKRPVGKHLL